MKKIKLFIKKYFNIFSVIAVLFFLISLLILLISEFSYGFSDFFNRYIGAAIRFVLSHITGILPFSLGETLFLSLPVFLFTVMFIYVKGFSDDEVKATRYLVTLFACAAIMFSTHIVTFGVAYNSTPLDKRLGIETKVVTANELQYTSQYLLDEIEQLVPEIDHMPNGSSRMPYSYKELNKKLNDAYIKASIKYEFIPKLKSNVKMISLSPIMTYTHVSGVYTYYTGEANINFNFPDYTAPFTMAHEMAHQRGVAPEDEANFVAFLVCMETDDEYIRYSAYMSIFEYVLSAFYEADSEKYSEFIAKADMRVRTEMVAFSEFFDQYRDSAASNVSNAINDTYLKASGESAGSKSYGLVVDLACAYFHE